MKIYVPAWFTCSQCGQYADYCTHGVAYKTHEEAVGFLKKNPPPSTHGEYILELELQE